MTYKVSKTVKVEPKLWNDAKERARDEGYTMEGLIRNLLLSYLGRGIRNESYSKKKFGQGG